MTSSNPVLKFNFVKGQAHSSRLSRFGLIYKIGTFFKESDRHIILVILKNVWSNVNSVMC